MFTFKVCIILIGSVVASHASCWRAFGYHDFCGLDSGQSMCSSSSHSGSIKHCEPIIVRPQEIPKPIIKTTLTPLPGPCACKKAIVKPAILPKPVCHVCSHSHHGGELYGLSTAHECSSSHNSHARSTHTGRGTCSICGHEVAPSYDSGVCAPADAVSITIAQQNAHQLCHHEEDRLAFGFRKIPIELPKQKIIRQNNVPEEKLFSLNGQIVELKPVKVCCSGKSVDEEAAEDLLALEEEEESSVVETCSPIKRISLGELGYVPAKIQKKTFVDVEGSASETASEETEECGCGSSSSAETSDISGYRAGNVVYKTVPKPSTLAIGSEDSADCESSEGGLEQSVVYEEEPERRPYGCDCGMVPCTCLRPCGSPHVCHTCSSSTSSTSTSSKAKKASVIIQKLCSRD